MWKMTEIFNEWSSGIGTYRDYLVVGITREEIIHRIRLIIGTLPDELVKQALGIKDTKKWGFSRAREKVKKKELENQIYGYAYRPFDSRWICYEQSLIDRDRFTLMKHLLRGNHKGNIALITSRLLSKPPLRIVLLVKI